MTVQERNTMRRYVHTLLNNRNGFRKARRYKDGVLQMAVLGGVITHHEWDRLTKQLDERTSPVDFPQEPQR